MSYTIFTRTWWIKNKDYPGGLEPGPGRKTIIRRGVETEEQARAFYQEWNETHDPGKLSRKAEYTRD